MAGDPPSRVGQCADGHIEGEADRPLEPGRARGIKRSASEIHAILVGSGIPGPASGRRTGASGIAPDCLAGHGAIGERSAHELAKGSQPCTERGPGRPHRRGSADGRAINIAKNPGSLPATLLLVGQRSNLPAQVRLNALAAIPGGVKRYARTVALLLANLNADIPVAVRSAAVRSAHQGTLTRPQLAELTHTLSAAGPLELDRLVDAFAQSGDEEVGLGLVKALKAAPARASLRAESLKPRLAKYGPSVAAAAQELYASLEQNFAQQTAQLEEILGSLKTGDIRRGQAVFNSTKAACITCHEIGYVGGHVGPDLTRIGKIRGERDLLESILFPSARLRSQLRARPGHDQERQSL